MKFPKVYKPPERLKSPIKAACEWVPQKKRPISVGANIEQRPWKKMVRKKRIASEPIYGRPAYKTIPPYLGPNVVDSKKKSAPAYSLKGRIVQKSTFAEDGPAKFDISGLTNRGITGAPAYTLKSRRQACKTFQPPAANRYDIDVAVKATTKTIPSYSLGKRPVHIKTIPTPGKFIFHCIPCIHCCYFFFYQKHQMSTICHP